MITKLVLVPGAVDCKITLCMCVCVCVCMCVCVCVCVLYTAVPYRYFKLIVWWVIAILTFR